jgi:hypothetical protein
VLEALKYDAKVWLVPIRLSVARDNLRAKAIYLRQGFTQVDVSCQALMEVCSVIMYVIDIENKIER